LASEPRFTHVLLNRRVSPVEERVVTQKTSFSAVQADMESRSMPILVSEARGGERTMEQGPEESEDKENRGEKIFRSSTLLCIIDLLDRRKPDRGVALAGAKGIPPEGQTLGAAEEGQG